MNKSCTKRNRSKDAGVFLVGGVVLIGIVVGCIVVASALGVFFNAVIP